MTSLERSRVSVRVSVPLTSCPRAWPADVHVVSLPQQCSSGWAGSQKKRELRLADRAVKGTVFNAAGEKNKEKFISRKQL